MKLMRLRLIGVATAAMLATAGFAAPVAAAGTGLDGTVTDALTGAPVAGGDVERALDPTARGTADIALMPIQYGSVAGRAL
jgi:hypothetical protein